MRNEESGQGSAGAPLLDGAAVLPVLAAATVLASAAWLRTHGLAYLVALIFATGLLGLSVWRSNAGRAHTGLNIRAILVAAVSVLMIALASVQQARIARMQASWVAYEAAVRSRAAGSLERMLTRAESELERTALNALQAPTEPEAAFRALNDLISGAGERSVILESAGTDASLPGADGPFAWAGTARIVPDLADGTHVIETPFYTLLAVVRTHEERRATATVVVNAVPPANRLAASLTSIAAERERAEGFEVGVEDGSAPGQGVFSPAAILPLTDGRELRAVPASMTLAEVQLRTEQRSRVWGLLLLTLLGGAFVLLVWPSYGVAGRAGVLLTGLAVVGLVPFNEVSNVARVFDPTVYFASIGGPWTGSVGALLLTGTFLLLGLLLLVRRIPVPASRPLSLLIVVAVGAGAPFLLRDLAQGIQSPASGMTTSLWVAYQCALFLAGLVLLLLVAAAGRILAARRSAFPPQLGSGLAIVGALLAPVLWEGPGRWPAWYVWMWVAAIVALASTSRGRRSLLHATVVAGLGATVLVWGELARERADLAVRELTGLERPDPAAVQLLERFAMDLMMIPAPSDAAALLRAYVASDLASADFPVLLGAWSDSGAIRDSLVLWRTGDGISLTREVTDTARVTGEAILVSGEGSLGGRLLLAVPHDGGGITSVVVAPAGSMFQPDPYLSLLALQRPDDGEQGYKLSVTPYRSRDSRIPAEPLWNRTEDEVHADWLTELYGQRWRVHAEVELRTLEALVPRGTLLLLLNIVLATVILALSHVGDGTIVRWFRRRASRWARSYRVRLSFVLFGFFVVPALAFAVWSSRRLQGDELQSRELLVWETLRVAEGNAMSGTLQSLRSSAPLFVYARGELVDGNDQLLEYLAPAGALLPPQVHKSLELDGEPEGSNLQEVAGTPVLFGYRLTSTPEGAAVLSAPARGDDSSISRRRRDVSVLVLFATAMGAAAALWLSGLAAREFARPIGALRRAALAIAGRRQEPALAFEPPSEFLPVFDAFRRMDGDLRASREALETAQRRTSDVLRTVASGVLAVDNSATITLFNPAAEKLLGSPLPAGARLHESAAAPLSDRVHAFLAGPGDEEEFDIETGSRQLHGSLSRLYGGAGGAVITLDDITELASAQRVLAWGEMARQVAHEIKNPLTPIRLGVQHLRRAYRDGKGDFGSVLDQNVGRILSEIDHLDEIARAFSRYGTAPEERAPAQLMDVRVVVHDVLELERLGEEGVEWTLSAPDHAVMAVARADELREVLLNILENARLADANRVEMCLTESDDGQVHIRVSDDGHGISPDVLPRIFEPHFSTRTSGSGLGLAISRRMVEAWGGTISVDGGNGSGTAVTVTLASGARV